MINSIIECELSYINLDHPDFLYGQNLFKFLEKQQVPINENKEEIVNQSNKQSQQQSNFFINLFGGGYKEKISKHKTGIYLLIVE